MNDVTITVLRIALLVVLFGFIAYGIWVIYTAVKKRWRRLGFQIGIPAVVILVLMGISSIRNASAYRQYLEGLFDTEAQLGNAVFRYDSERSFHGDGYSIAVYPLPSSIRARFESADEKLLSEFPKHPSYRNHWKFEHWKRAPFDEKFNHYLDFALSSYDTHNAPKLTEHFDAIRAALEQDSTFYAFFHLGSSTHATDIDLFIVDLKNGRLYLINHNT